MMHVNANTNTLFFVDGMKGGHHTTDICIHSRAALELGYEVVACAAEPESISQWVKKHCPSHFSHFSAHHFGDIAPSRSIYKRVRPIIDLNKRWFATSGFINQIVRKSNITPSFIFFNYLDGYVGLGISATLVNRLIHYRWSGLYFSSSYQRFGIRHHQWRKGPMNPFEAIRSHKCNAIAALDESSAHTLERMVKKKVIAFPDPQDDVAPDDKFWIANDVRTRAKGRPIIGAIGSLAQRKGIALLAEVARQCADRGWFFVFAGHLVRETYSARELEMIDNLVSAKPDHCYFYLQHIDHQSQFNAMIAACDIIFIAYENFLPSSGVLTKAALFNKPVIVSKGYCMAERVQRFGLGATIYQGNAEECINAIELLTDSSKQAQFSFDFAGYCSEHSPERLRITLKELIET